MRTQTPEAVWSSDLSPVTAKLTSRGADAARVEREFRRFAALCHAHPAEDLAPSRAVDDYWHEFILDTRRYHAFCAQVYGEYLHHLPDDAGKGMRAQFERTVSLYGAAFGPPDPVVWAEPGGSMVGRRVRGG